MDAFEGNGWFWLVSLRTEDKRMVSSFVLCDGFAKMAKVENDSGRT